jgi:hypothetical protein
MMQQSLLDSFAPVLKLFAFSDDLDQTHDLTASDSIPEIVEFAHKRPDIHNLYMHSHNQYLDSHFHPYVLHHSKTRKHQEMKSTCATES